MEAIRQPSSSRMRPNPDDQHAAHPSERRELQGRYRRSATYP